MQYIEEKGINRDNSNFKYLVFICILRLLLEYLYTSIIYPAYSYVGFEINKSLPRTVLSWFILIIFAVLFIKISSVDKCGATIISILLLFSAVPTTIIIAYYSVSMNFIFLNIAYWISITFMYLGIKEFKIKKTKNDFLLYFFTILFGVSILYICIRYTGFDIDFNLWNVYDKRADFLVYNVPKPLTYVFNASVTAFPIIFIYSLRKKKYMLSIVSCLFQILAFSCDGRKSTLFSLIITFFVYFFISKFSSRYFVPLVNLLFIASILENKLFQTYYLTNFVVRRLFIVPAYLHTSYYDFFSENKKDIFRQSILGHIGFESPYYDMIPNIIGSSYYIDAYANNGLFSDAYANLGWIGVFIMPLFIVLALKFLDSCSAGISTKTCIGIIIVSSFAFLSSSFFVVLLTHGFILNCFLMLIIGEDDNI